MRILYVLALFVLIFLSGYTSLSINPGLSQESIDGYIEKVLLLVTDKYDREIILYIDLDKPSAEYRFFVVDIANRKVLDAGLTCNGVTDKSGNTVYSIRPGSKASSKGLYKVGHSYKGRFGKAYKLHELSLTNSHAYARAVVLHSSKWMPRWSTGFSIFKSQGCPTIHPEFLKRPL